MTEIITKNSTEQHLKNLGVEYKQVGLTLKEHICDATTEIYGQTFNVNVYTIIGYGIQIRVSGNPKVCMISYESMLKMAEAMGIFDFKNEQE